MTEMPVSLLRGYREFRSNRYPAEARRYQELVREGQKPETLVIACCDSRVAPETIFNAAPGEIFVVRNVANMVPPYKSGGELNPTSAALEFAVQGLRVRHIVVLGHGLCGGISAALDPAPEPLSPGDFVGRWMEPLAPAAEQVSEDSSMTPAERQTTLERMSIRRSLENLMTFPFVSNPVGRGKLHLHGMWFDISEGDLQVMDPETGDFVAAGTLLQ